jgi:hypothetical protein
MKCKGSYIHSARNIVYNGDKIQCELRRKDNTYEKNEITFSDKHDYHNINGRFQWIFDKSVLFLIINMNKNKERWENISIAFDDIKKKYNCDYIRIEGVEGKNMKDDISAIDILKPREDLIGREFNCCESNEIWEYDGTISKSFPGLFLNGHEGTKGLTISNIKCLTLIKEQYPDYNWYCILEDDCEMNEITYNQIMSVIQNTNYLNDVILLDKRKRGGTCAMLYNQRIINNMITNLHPLSEFSITKEEKYKKTNLWDWKLWVYLDNFKIKHTSCPVVKSGNFISEIS